MSLSVLRVTDSEDLSTLTKVFMDATKGTDSFHEMMVRYAPKSPYNGMMDAMAKSLEDPNHYIFKAVIMEDGHKIETIVGMALWKIGYIEIEKVDPFAEKQEVSDSPSMKADAFVAPLEGATPQGRETGNGAMDGFREFQRTRTSIVNEYIKQVRGKRHVFLSRIAVHPNHQKKGVGDRLLQWGVDVADEEGIIAYLNARPAALRLYKKAGWKAVAKTEFMFDDLEVAPITSMLRLPVSEKKRQT